MLESVLIRYYKFGFLPYQFKEPAIQINPSVRFLSGENQKNMRLSQEVFSHNIKTIVSMLCEISQAMSHQPSSINMYINANSPGYLFTGISFVLAEFLLWHKQFIDKNIIDGTKSSHFKTLIEESPEGVIQLDEHRNYHCCGILIHYHKLESLQLTIGDTIRITKCNVNNKYNENECPYKTYAQKLEKI